ncbi:hypothetical protein [Sorangium cellulosum]|nr:hypothetical protein [Sorangium cellulosum]
MALTHRPRASRLPFASLTFAAAYAPAALACAFALGACGKEFTAHPPDASTSTGGGGIGGGEGGGGGLGGGGGDGAGGGTGGGCPGGGAVCGAACVDLETDAEHCGACDNACSTFGGTSICRDGACQPPVCEPGRGDCDRDPGSGCEEDLSTSAAHCGTCDKPCAGQCVRGACASPVQISVGADYTCAVLSDQTVWCWGRNTWGNLGDGTRQQDRPIPRQVMGLAGHAVQVAAGLSASRTHTCAVLTDGAVACWGAGNSGQLGDGNTASSLVPLRVKDLTTATRIAVGAAHTCAVTSAHTLWCWGEGGDGQLGYGGHDDQAAPLVILDGVETVAAGLAHTCAGMSERMGESRMRCWGNNLDGQLGLGDFSAKSTPTLLARLSSVAHVAVGTLHTCAAPLSGVASCWGKGDHFRLGTGFEASEAFPREVPEVVDVAGLALGARHSGAVLTGGEVLMWGDNAKGQLGNGTLDRALTPQRIELPSAVALALGEDHSCALTRSGEMLCWGDNTNGQLGDGTTEQRLVPTPVRWPAR